MLVSPKLLPDTIIEIPNITNEQALTVLKAAQQSAKDRASVTKFKAERDTATTDKKTAVAERDTAIKEKENAENQKRIAEAAHGRQRNQNGRIG